MSGEGLLAVARLPRVLNKVKAVEIDAGHHARGRSPSLGPARRIDHLLAGPFTGKDRKLPVLGKRHRRSETVWGHGLPSLDSLNDLLCGVVEIIGRQHVEAGFADDL